MMFLSLHFHFYMHDTQFITFFFFFLISEEWKFEPKFSIEFSLNIMKTQKFSVNVTIYTINPKKMAYYNEYAIKIEIVLTNNNWLMWK